MKGELTLESYSIVWLMGCLPRFLCMNSLFLQLIFSFWFIFFISTQAAAGWPVSELLDRSIANYFGVDSALDDADRVPLILNSAVRPEFWGFFLGLSAAIDTYGVKRARANIPGYTPGALGWDPLKLYPVDEDGQKQMQLAEIKHGRTAMVAVTGFASQEYLTKMGVVDETPFFFFPITETAEDVLKEVVSQM